MNTHTIHRRTTVAMLALCAATALSAHAAPSRMDTAEHTIGQSDVDVRQLYDEAQAQLKAERYNEAAESYVWLWKNMVAHQPSMHGVRVSFMARDLHTLVQAHPGARTAFAQFRDEAWLAIEQAAAQGTTDHAAILDWMVLCHNVLDDSDRVLDWAIHADTTEEGRAILKRRYYLIDDLLLENGHTAILGRAMPSGESFIAKTITSYQRRSKDTEAILLSHPSSSPQADAQMLQIAREGALKKFGKNIAQGHIAYLAADRHEEAWLVLTEALETLNNPIMCETILLELYDAGVAEQRHIDLLE